MIAVHPFVILCIAIRLQASGNQHTAPLCTCNPNTRTSTLVELCTHAHLYKSVSKTQLNTNTHTHADLCIIIFNTILGMHMQDGAEMGICSVDWLALWQLKYIKIRCGGFY